MTRGITFIFITSLFCITECEFNSNLNDLATLKVQSSPGWIIDCKKGVWMEEYMVASNCQNWFGWVYPSDCSISTTLRGKGRAVLDFGNCNFKGLVKASIDGIEIGTASANEGSKKIEFEFGNDSELKIVEEQAIIQFNSLEMISCSKGKYSSK